MSAFAQGPAGLHLILEVPAEAAATPRPAADAAGPARLARLLGRARRMPASASGPRSEVARALGLDGPIPWAAACLAASAAAEERAGGNAPLPGAAGPAAAASAATPAGAADAGSTFLLEPVRLHAGMNNVSLQTLAEPLAGPPLEELAGLLQPLLADYGARLVRHGSQLLVRFDAELAARTRALEDCVGRDLRECLPDGRDAGPLRRLMTECQMVLHRAGELQADSLNGVNGVWLWGEGALPGSGRDPDPPPDAANAEAPLPGPAGDQAAAPAPAGERPGAARLHSADPLLRALAAALGTDTQLDALAAGVRAGTPGTRWIWHASSTDARLAGLLEDATRALWRGRLDALDISLWPAGSAAGAGRWRLGRSGLLRFWRAPLRALAPAASTDTDSDSNTGDGPNRRARGAPPRADQP